jgi:transposase
MALSDEVIAADRAARSHEPSEFELWRRAQTDGLSIRKAAEELGVSATTVYWRRRTLADEDEFRMLEGRDGKRRPNRHFDNTDRDARIHELRADGKSIRVIAAEVGCSVGTVHRVLN